MVQDKPGRPAGKAGPAPGTVRVRGCSPAAPAAVAERRGAAQSCRQRAARRAFRQRDGPPPPADPKNGSVVSDLQRVSGVGPPSVQHRPDQRPLKRSEVNGEPSPPICPSVTVESSRRGKVTGSGSFFGRSRGLPGSGRSGAQKTTGRTDRSFFYGSLQRVYSASVTEAQRARSACSLAVRMRYSTRSTSGMFQRSIMESRLLGRKKL